MKEIRQHIRKFNNRYNVPHSSHGYSFAPISKIRGNFIKSKLEGSSLVDDKAYYLVIYAESAIQKWKYKHRYNNHNDEIFRIRYYV